MSTNSSATQVSIPINSPPTTTAFFIFGGSPAMTRHFDILPLLTESGSTVLIEGASGTGKKLFTGAIHHLFPRWDTPFVAVNCVAFVLDEISDISLTIQVHLLRVLQKQA
ncbi:sigma 54-interacting transcriptional regulator [Sediminispirochaeta smaragdinae]|uniref:sigma 54-interacting transcriptional regulator n=1 Tax=Sediminispirochaeta smaragdinae TaxID=55206 RepID=UPI000BA9D335